MAGDRSGVSGGISYWSTRLAEEEACFNTVGSCPVLRHGSDSVVFGAEEIITYLKKEVLLVGIILPWPQSFFPNTID